MTTGAPRLHSPDSRISWRVNSSGIASTAAAVSALGELSREIRTGLDQFIVCHLGSSDRSRQRLCASRFTVSMPRNATTQALQFKG